MSAKIDEVRLDIKELNSLLEQARRQSTKDVLTPEIRRLETELAKLLEENKNASVNEVKLNNYGWDQTLTTIKIYITLKDVHQLPKDAITCDFTEKSLDLRVLGLDKKNYNLMINDLCSKIDTEKSYFKVNTNIIIILLAKKVANKNWPHVTVLLEKRIKNTRSSIVEWLRELDMHSDPCVNMMNLMKKLYQNGDDEMKKIIAKAWTESEEKQISCIIELFSQFRST